MPNRDGLSCFLAIAAVVCLGWTAQAPAASIDEPVLLVAQRKLQSPIYSSTVLLVKPIANGAHIGFIVNKPTRMKLGELFPEHEPSRKVADPLFLGGPADLNTVFALVERHGAAGDGALQITPDLFLAAEVKAVDHVIEAEADHARFFVGLVVWRPAASPRRGAGREARPRQEDRRTLGSAGAASGGAREDDLAREGGGCAFGRVFSY